VIAQKVCGNPEAKDRFLALPIIVGGHRFTAVNLLDRSKPDGCDVLPRSFAACIDAPFDESAFHRAAR
jgi:hypothetical protein